MSEVVRQEAAFFFASIATGIILVWSYDIFRIFRRAVPHHTLAVSIEDLLYWFAVSLIIFGMIFEKNDGALRGYAFVGILIGAWAQIFVESFFHKIWIKMLKKTEKKGKMSLGKRR
ncbi:MAG: spore cortex biosynthesis protein YabQ [Eubacteriales bacterium]|nr:spore cortex biosynthesis protein YabQ [Eubacteriales bacterium]